MKKLHMLKTTIIGTALLPLPLFLLPTSTLPVNASPTGSCAGTEIDRHTLSNGVIRLYYDSSTGKNCVKTFANNTSKLKYMGAYVYRSKDNVGSSDYNYYSHPK